MSAESVGLTQKKIGRKPDTAREGEARPKGSAGGTPAPPDYSSAELVEAENSPSGLQLSSRIGSPPNEGGTIK